MKSYGPFDHHNYQVLDHDCSCDICMDWRKKLAVYAEKHSTRHIIGERCGCSECKGYYEARSAYVAATNRRDIYSESSWHASSHAKTWGGLFMAFIKANMVEPDRKSRGWWEGKGGSLPLEHWFVRFDDHMLAVSGVGWTASYSGVSLDRHLVV